MNRYWLGWVPLAAIWAGGIAVQYALGIETRSWAEVPIIAAVLVLTLVYAGIADPRGWIKRGPR